MLTTHDGLVSITFRSDSGKVKHMRRRGLAFMLFISYPEMQYSGVRIPYWMKHETCDDLVLQSLYGPW